MERVLYHWFTATVDGTAAVDGRGGTEGAGTDNPRRPIGSCSDANGKVKGQGVTRSIFFFRPEIITERHKREKDSKRIKQGNGWKRRKNPLIFLRSVVEPHLDGDIFWRPPQRFTPNGERIERRRRMNLLLGRRWRRVADATRTGNGRGRADT